MGPVLLVHTGLAMAAVGVIAAALALGGAVPVAPTTGLWLIVTSVAMTLLGALLPAPEHRVAAPRTTLDTFSPAWQFNEVHATHIAAPPIRVYDAVRAVTAAEIRFFRTLTWMRRGGRPLPPGILNPPPDLPLIDAAVGGGFLLLAEDPPRELVAGMIVRAPAGARIAVTAGSYGTLSAAGYAKATLNFLIEADGDSRSRLSTETRVFATDAASRRWFALYWRCIYPGSALIRRMWLRAIARRATRAR